MTELALILLLALVVIGALAIHSHRTTARKRVNAECLVCPYLETFQDATAARSAAEDHAKDTSHALILVFAGPVRANG